MVFWYGGSLRQGGDQESLTCRSKLDSFGFQMNEPETEKRHGAVEGVDSL